MLLLKRIFFLRIYANLWLKGEKEKSGMCSLSTCLDFSFGGLPLRQGASAPKEQFADE